MDLIIIGATSNICKIRVFENLNQIQETIKRVICVSRKNYSLTEWKEYLSSLSIINFNLIDKVDYVQCFYQLSDYQQKLGPLIHKDTLVYVSTPPNCYPDLIEFINHIDQGTLVLEKPLSLNYEQYLDLKATISPRIQMIDHFLYKVDVQKIITEFSGPLKSIHFRFLYTDDLENRLGYFDQTGFFIDMFQSHFLSILYCLIKEELEMLKSAHIQIDRKQYQHYGGKNPEAETYFLLTITYDQKVFKFEAGKSMNELCKEIIVNGETHTINDYQNEYSIFFSKLHSNNNLLLKQETFWEITENVKKHFTEIDYYPKNKFSGTLEEESQILMF